MPFLSSPASRYPSYTWTQSRNLQLRITMCVYNPLKRLRVCSVIYRLQSSCRICLLTSPLQSDSSLLGQFEPSIKTELENEQMWILFFGAWGGLSSPFRKRDIFPRVEDSSAASHGSLITACVTPSQCVCRGAAEEQQKVLRAEGIEVNPVGGEMTSAAWDAPSLRPHPSW